MKLSKRSRSAALLAAVALAAAGCSTQEDSATPAPGQTGAAGEVKTDVGVEGNTIKLGVLTDLTGVFAALGKDITQAHQLYWDQNKVCDKYSVELDVKDTGYVPQTGVQLYSGMKDEVLAMQQIIGSPLNTALAPEFESDNIVTLPSAWASNLTKAKGAAMVGATYPIEMANGYSYMFEKGFIKEGDTVGHIYFTGEYGQNGLAGSRAVAKEKNLKLIEAEIAPRDEDMTAQIANFKSQGVKLIVLTVAPTQTKSVAVVAKQQGLNVPILGSNPVFSPALLKTEAGDALRENLYVSSPISSFDKHPELLKAYTEANPDSPPSLGVVFGYGMSEVLKQILDDACAKGDLTRDGVMAAFEGLSAVDTGGLIVPLTGFKQGTSPSLESFIVRPADVPGGAKLEKDSFEGEFAAALLNS